MRDKTASRTFRAKKKLDHLLEGLLSGIYLPLYTTCHAGAARRRMVTFTRIPYADLSRHSFSAGGSRPTRAAAGPHRLRRPHFFLGVDRHPVDRVLSLHRPLKRCIASLGDSLHTLLV
jgi:hypothetical protein